MQIGSVSESPPSTVGPSVSEVGKKPGQVGAVTFYFDAEDNEDNWVLGVDDTKEDEVLATLPSPGIMVGSGAVRSFFRQGDFQAPVVEDGETRPLIDISCGLIKQFGRQEPRVRLNSGRQASLKGVCTGARKSALAVSSCCDQGSTVVFSGGESFITKTILKPADAGDIERRGNLFYLPLQEITPPHGKDDFVLAPIGDEIEAFGPQYMQEEGSSSSAPAEAAAAPMAVEPPAEAQEDEFDGGYDRAVREGEVLPFGAIRAGGSGGGKF